MDYYDKKIKDIVSINISENSNFENIINNALYNKDMIKKHKKLILIKTIINIILSIIFGSTVVFAGYTVYDKIWKKPIQYDSYQEKTYAEKKDENITKEETMNVISSEEIKNISNEVLKSLNYNNEDTLLIKLKRSYSATSNLYYEVKTTNDYSSGIEMNFDAINGNLNYFIDRDIENKYDVNTEKLNNEEVIKIGEEIKRCLKLTDNYKLKDMNEIENSNNGKSRYEWYLKYCLQYDTILNEYQRLEIRLYKTNNKLKISQIAIYDDGYKYDNNVLNISKDVAIETAINKDRLISELKIESINAELSIRPINEFVYLQEISNGKDDGLKNEILQNGSNITYNQYSNDKTLRKVWDIKINYEFIFDDSEPVHNWKEQFGRHYYIDATTGEIIGGTWGESIYN